MTQTLIQPPKTILEVWESLPEGTLCQLINNNLIMSPAPSILHQEILNEINVGIAIFLRTNHIGKVLIAPLDVQFSMENILQPDIIFIKNENVNKLKSKRLSGAPDLIIEILSPSTSQFDYVEKKIIYERFGVNEYFIVEPNSKSVDSFFLKNGEYKEQKSTIGKINSIVLGTEISF